MKNKFVWIIAVILIVEFLVYRSMQKEEHNMFTDSFAQLDNVYLDDINNSNYEMLEYTNTNNYEVEISTNSIEVNCLGIGENKEDDENLVNNNFQIEASFSKEPKSTKYKSLTIKEDEKVYIHIKYNYLGDFYPQNEVSCHYNISLDTV